MWCHSGSASQPVYQSTMDKWRGKVAIVTGASSGIGAAIAKELAKQGMVVVGVARREDRIKELAQELMHESGKLIALKTDLRKEEEITKAFAFVEKELGGADVLVNNSGVSETEEFSDGRIERWREILEVNVLAVCICSKLFLQSARRRKLQQGHIININSVLGHQVDSGRAAVYQASKHAVTVLSKCMRRELADQLSTVKVTSISPGMTRTEIVKGTIAELMFDTVPVLEAADVADVTVNVLSASDVTQICEVVLTPVPNKFGVY